MQKEAIKMAKVGGLQKIYMFKEPNQKYCLYVKVIILYQAVCGIITTFNVVIDYGRLLRYINSHSFHFYSLNNLSRFLQFKSIISISLLQIANFGKEKD